MTDVQAHSPKLMSGSLRPFLTFIPQLQALPCSLSTLSCPQHHTAPPPTPLFSSAAPQLSTAGSEIILPSRISPAQTNAARLLGKQPP